MTACLSNVAAHRPSFADLAVLLQDLRMEVATGVYNNGDGRPAVCASFRWCQHCLQRELLHTSTATGLHPTRVAALWHDC